MRKAIFSILFLCLLAVGSAQTYLPKSDGEVVAHTYYTLAYSEEHEQAEWVFYQLSEAMLANTTSRSNSFKADKSVSTGSAVHGDYTSSGYDRGHLCPAASMTINEVAMKESFYMSNVSPQSPSFNRGGWKQLEELVRSWAIDDSILYVVTGPILTETMGSIGKSNKVSVPKEFYKIVYSPKKMEMIGFVMPNEKIDMPLASYATSVDYVEEQTGIDFFYEYNLDREELEFNLQEWSFGGDGDLAQ